MTFAEQVDVWQAEASTRARKPLRANTIAKVRSYLNNHVIPYIGELPLEEVGRLPGLTVRNNCIEHWSKLSPATQDEILKSITRILNTCYDSEGNKMYPVRWDKDFLDVPAVNPIEQPSFTVEQCQTIVSASKGKYQFLYVLLAATGMRRSEALALTVNDISQDGSTITVSKSVYNGKIGDTKSKSGNRTIDVCSNVASYFARYRQVCIDYGQVYLFSTNTGEMMGHQTVYKFSLSGILSKLGLQGYGLHSFRRYRATHLQRENIPDNLINYWMGWKQESGMLSHYSRLIKDEAWRKEQAERVGIGFEID